MGFLDVFKGTLSKSSLKKERDLEAVNCLKGAHENIRLAADSISSFLNDVRDYYPARRHEELYKAGVKDSLVGMKDGLKKGLVFLDERMNNKINTLGAIKNVNHLKTVLDNCAKILGPENPDDIITILTVEMWNEERAKRGFPQPRNRDVACNNLRSAANYLKTARKQLEDHEFLLNAPGLD